MIVKKETQILSISMSLKPIAPILSINVKQTMNKQRLQQIHDHMLSNKRRHKVFNYGTYDSECGTVGCIIGECPILWPSDWEFDPWHNPEIRHPEFIINNHGSPVINDIMEWFEITEDEANHLFYPSNNLPETATLKEVCTNLQSFINAGKE